MAKATVRTGLTCWSVRGASNSQCIYVQPSGDTFKATAPRNNHLSFHTQLRSPNCNNNATSKNIKLSQSTVSNPHGHTCVANRWPFSEGACDPYSVAWGCSDRVQASLCDDRQWDQWVRYEDHSVITLHVQGIHPSGQVTRTRPVQWQPPCSDMVSMLHPSITKLAASPTLTGSSTK